MDRRFERSAALLFRATPAATEQSEAYTITYITYGPGDLSGQRGEVKKLSLSRSGFCRTFADRYGKKGVFLRGPLFYGRENTWVWVCLG